MHFRKAKSSDHNDILNIYLSAFPESENKDVANLAIELLAEKTTPETISLVAESGDTVVGHITFSPVVFDNNDSQLGYILAPLAVSPDYQKQRTGSQLIEKGKEILLKKGVNFLFVYGDPEYYCRFGFSKQKAEKHTPKHKLQYPFGWQAIILKPLSGETIPGKIVCVAALDKPELW